MLATPRLLVLVTLSLLAAAWGAPVHAEEPVSRVTYYLHAHSPIGDVDEFHEFGAGGPGTFMDATPPASPVSKVSQTVLGNQNVRENAFNTYWTGAVRGTVSNAVATVYLQANVPGPVTVSLFGDGASGTQAPFARATVSVVPGVARAYVVPLPGTANVADEIELSLNAGFQGVTTLFDSVAHPASITFDLGAYVPPPPVDDLLPPPAAGWQNLVTVGEGGQAHREASLAINPMDPDEMVVCTPSGVPALTAGHSHFFITTDGGATWDYLDVEPEATDGRRAAFEGGDCDVMYDAGGTLYTADTWLGSLSVGASRDGGRTWTGTPIAASGAVVDRPWLVGGPDGTVHVTYQDVQFAMPTVIWYTRSTDHGQTFLPAVPVAVAEPDAAFSWQGNFVVTADQQTLYSIHTKRLLANQGLEANGPEQVVVMASRDGGVTWTKHHVASMPNPASFLYPVIGMDAAGILHAAWASKSADESDHPVWYAYSTDGALSWSAPVKLLEGSGAYAPWIEGAGPGEAVVHWLGTATWTPAILSQNADWYLYAGRITGVGQGAPIVDVGPTSAAPMFTGKHSATPEFNMVRVGPGGEMRIAASLYSTHSAGATGWEIYYQESS